MSHAFRTVSPTASPAVLAERGPVHAPKLLALSQSRQTPAILHWVLGDLRKRGSFESYLIEMGKAARAAGVRMHIVSGKRADETILASLRAAGVEVTCVDDVTLDTVGYFARQVRRVRPWLVHCHFGSPSTRFAAVAKLLGVRRFVFTDHGSRSAQQMAEQPRLMRQLRRKFYARFIDLYLPVSDFVARQLAREVGPRQGRVHRLYNGIEVDRYNPATDPAARAVGRACLFGIGPDRRCVAYVGQLTREKGVDDILAVQDEILARHPDVVFVWIGDGPLRPDVQARVSDRVLYLGLRNDVQHLLPHVDVQVAPSRWHEAFCLTVAEGAACGVPAVVSRIGGIPEVVVDGESGLLVAPGDREALAAAIDRLLGDETLRAAMAAAARTRAEKMFSLENMVATTFAQYRRLGLPVSLSASR